MGEKLQRVEFIQEELGRDSISQQTLYEWPKLERYGHIQLADTGSGSSSLKLERIWHVWPMAMATPSRRKRKNRGER